MIVEPVDWDYIYKVPTLSDIEKVMFSAVGKTNCSNLCLSGGIDSSLTLHILSQLHHPVICFTIASSPEHPDLHYAKVVASKYQATHLVYIPTTEEIESNRLDGDVQGDVAVRLLYQFIAKYTDEVISTDCIDELDCGYYAHAKEPTDEVFRRLIYELEANHLKPLDKNSGKVKVHLPYASREVVNTFLRLPIAGKVSGDNRKSHVTSIASKYLPDEIIKRRKYGFCSALEPVKL